MIQPRWIYLLLVLCMIIWLAILPAPLGYRSGLLAGALCLPLVIPLPGILRQQYKASIWGAYISLLPFLFTIMELWANPTTWPGATVGLILVLLYWVLVVLAARRGSLSMPELPDQ